MAKAILISIQPKYVADILNGNKTLEIRKTAPKCDLPIDVYIYCTKDRKYANLINRGGFLTGMVVAKFTLKNWTKWKVHPEEEPDEEDREISKSSCLSVNETIRYAAGKPICGWHIDNLVIFDKPKEIKNFLTYSHIISGIGFKGESKGFEILKPLTRAPQSWKYVEV